MSEQLKACPFCGGDVQFHADDECDGCHYIHCANCDAFFDFASGADPKNESATIEALRSVCAMAWNRRAQDFDTLAQRLQEAESALHLFVDLGVTPGGWVEFDEALSCASKLLTGKGDKP